MSMGGRLWAVILLAAMLAVWLTVPAAAEKRVALVIGNSAYSRVGHLANPANDAAAFGALLKGVGFDVVETRRDLGIAEFRRAVGDFAAAVRGADIAVVFYAGHGFEADGKNFLIPVDAKLARDFDIEDEALSLERVLRVVEGARRLRLVILDACRDSRLFGTMARTVVSRSINRGLARVEPTASDTLIAFAAKAGTVAEDGAGSHSPFTAALLKHIAVPGLDIRLALGNVRDEVLKSTGHRQEPFVYGSLGGGVVALVPPAARRQAAGEPRQDDPDHAARQDYGFAAQVDTVAAYDSFLARYPAGYFADLARARRAKLTESTRHAPVPAAGDSRGQLTRPLPGRGDADPGPSAAFDVYRGLTFSIAFRQMFHEVSPLRTVWPAARRITVAVRSEQDIATQATTLSERSGARRSLDVTAGLDGSDPRLSWRLEAGRLVGTLGEPGFTTRFAISRVGDACSASVKVENPRGAKHFVLNRMSTGTPMTVAAIRSERISCRLVEDAVVAERRRATR
jgi:uncharacterized caspase-like protein